MTVLWRHRLQSAVEAVINGPSRGPHPRLARALGLLATGYGGAMALRQGLYRHRFLTVGRLTCPVVSVGNLTVGGTGKTPLVVELARRLCTWGLRPVVISRGYRGRAERAGGVVSDGKRLRMGPEEAGDEPFMMAAELTRVPVVVGGDRFRAGCLAQSTFDPDVIVLDDAFQHIQLHRDINLLVMDHRSPFGNGRLLPRGPLREPLSALTRADAFILSGAGYETPAGDLPLPDWTHRLPGGRPVFRTYASLRVRQAAGFGGLSGCGPAFLPANAETLYGRRGVAFSGIARNHRFIDGLNRLGLSVAHEFAYPDHHCYADAELARIARTAMGKKADMVVTTEKDWARIFHRIDWPLPVVVVGIETGFGPRQADFDRFIGQGLAVLGKQGGRY
ncbi:MAG: tetraacyldisaccharide 4'-kinase [Desulfobacterales bacterium]|nr:tetraacyldisaccharide 4'-kinase [Desulfobacterales bacterium]